MPWLLVWYDNVGITSIVASATWLASSSTQCRFTTVSVSAFSTVELILAARGIVASYETIANGPTLRLGVRGFCQAPGSTGLPSRRYHPHTPPTDEHSSNSSSRCLDRGRGAVALAPG